MNSSLSKWIVDFQKNSSLSKNEMNWSLFVKKCCFLQNKKIVVFQPIE